MSAKGLILEGISGTGKSTLYRRLLQHPVFVAWEAKIALSEAFTERAIEHLPSKTLEASLDLLSDITGMLGGLARRWSEGKFADDPTMAPAFILERFHLTHAVMYNQGNLQDYRRVDELLRFLGTKLVLCVVDDEELPARLSSTRQTRDDDWNHYLDERIAGRTATMAQDEVDKRIEAHYKEQQRQYREMADASYLSTLVIDTTRGDWPMYEEQIVHFWALR